MEARRTNISPNFPKIALSDLVAVLLLVTYFLLFLFIPNEQQNHASLFNILWHGQWINDDAMQQTFPFYQAIDEDIFKGDLITQMMSHYLTPLHYLIGMILTWTTNNPIITSNIIMLIQLLLTMGFIGATVYTYTKALIPACFSMIWLLHSRSIVERFGGGLTRGWMLPVLAAFLFAQSRKSSAIYLVLIIGVFVHPVSTFIAAFSYGILIAYDLFRNYSALIKARILKYIAFSALLAITLLYITTPSPNLGQMSNLEKAAAMPEFQKNNGRFPLLPFDSALEEISNRGFEVFFSGNAASFHSTGRILSFIIIISTLLAGMLPVKPKGTSSMAVLEPELYIYAGSCLITYIIARLMAFSLYVPDRYIQLPLALFFIISFTIISWKIFSRIERKNRKMPQWCILALLAAFIYANSGTGLKGNIGLGFPIEYYGKFNLWLKDNTNKNAVIAGDPTITDTVPLLSYRKVYISSETLHPFYDKYYAAAKPRYELSIKTEFAKDIQELQSLTRDGKFDYFIFWKNQFLPSWLASAGGYAPYNMLRSEIIRRNKGEFAYFQLIKEKHRSVVYQDDTVMIVNVNLL